MSRYPIEDYPYIRSLIDARIKEYHDAGDHARDVPQAAAQEWDMHTGYIPKEDHPKGWKDPYAKVDKKYKNYCIKPTAKPKAKAKKK